MNELIEQLRKQAVNLNSLADDLTDCRSVEFYMNETVQFMVIPYETLPAEVEATFRDIIKKFRNVKLKDL